MAKDVIYTNGVIAVKEKSLLGDRLYKLAEMSLADAFRSLTESGFGKGAEVSSYSEYEKLIAAEERETDAFIREYAPTDAEKEYLLAPRDFHNAKAAFKAELLGGGAEGMLAPDGLVPAQTVVECVKSGNCDMLCDELKGALAEANGLKESGNATGAEIGVIFDRALYRHLFKACRRNSFLKKLLKEKSDMGNILTAVRADSYEFAARCFTEGGALSAEDFKDVFSDDENVRKNALNGTEYYGFYRLCEESKAAGKPLTNAEREYARVETEQLYRNRFELKRAQPFLYYVLRRRAEMSDVRIIFVCLAAGYGAKDILSRLRSVR